MTQPAPNEYLVQAIDNLTASNRDLFVLNKDLVAAVQHESELRTDKIQSLEITNNRLTTAIKYMGGCLVLLLLLAGVNFYNTTVSRHADESAQQTNKLLLGCYIPGDQCWQQNRDQQIAAQSQIRQTVFVISICQRSFPSNPNVLDPEGNTKKLLDCIHQYYPDLQLPPKGK